MTQAFNPGLEARGHSFNLGQTFWRECVSVGAGFLVPYTLDITGSWGGVDSLLPIICRL